MSANKIGEQQQMDVNGCETLSENHVWFTAILWKIMMIGDFVFDR